MEKLQKLRLILVLVLVSMIATLFFLYAFFSPISSPYEVTRIRNSFLAEAGARQDFAWEPTNPPESFLIEKLPTPPEFLDIAATNLQLPTPPIDNWRKSQILAQHLGQGPGTGEGIMSNTLDAYRKILTERRGYCSDYTQVFNGLALAADIPVREWGMSFDGFSGYGHAYNEVYDYSRQKWIFIDVFYSFYVEDALTNTPLSVQEFRAKLLAGATDDDLLVKSIEEKRFKFPSKRDALEYYRRGADQFYLWFGNNVFSYDNHQLIRLFSPLSRSLEQAIAMFVGIHPRIRIIVSETNKELIKSLFNRRDLFVLTALHFLALVTALIFTSWEYQHYRK